MSVWIRRGVFASGMMAVAGFAGWLGTATAQTVAANAAPADSNRGARPTRPWSRRRTTSRC